LIAAAYVHTQWVKAKAANNSSQGSIKLAALPWLMDVSFIDRGLFGAPD